MYLKPNRSKQVGIRSYKLKVTNMIFKRAYDEQYSREIFKIVKRFLMQNIPQYRICDLKDELIKGNFYESELQKVDKDQDSLWFVEKKIRKRKRKGIVEWLVKFDGFDDRFNQWIPEKDITDVLDTDGTT